MTGALFAWDVRLDGEKVTELRKGGYFYSTVSPGPHTISVNVLSGIMLKIVAEPDEPYYVRVGAGTTFTEHIFKIERVSETQALNELYDMKLQPGVDGN